VISERMGHASVKFTMDRYTHLSDAHHRAAADRIAEVLEGAETKNMIGRPTNIRKLA
jgi:hypothetical protein